MRRCGLWILVAITFLTGRVVAEDRMELHLVMAFDVSASVNDEEFDLQRAGTADALRSKLVAAAVERSPGGVAIAIVQWSSVTRQALGMDWVVLRNQADVIAYADEVDAMPRRLPGGGTMIHSGLAFAARLLEAAPGYARRQVIDIAANGQSDGQNRLLETRGKLLSKGIVINGLAIEEDDTTLTQYFEAHVIGGPNAFVVTASGFDAFTEAMETKLLREISGAMFSHDVDKPVSISPRLAAAN
ncbi:DUF1194 domain-containing protein [Roseovarius aestuarii]|nr:DUF1194 domain-containing protein [Roseovarius aestuarii]